MLYKLPIKSSFLKILNIEFEPYTIFLSKEKIQIFFDLKYEYFPKSSYRTFCLEEIEIVLKWPTTIKPSEGLTIKII